MEPCWLLHLEGASIFLITGVLYSRGHYRWWLYAVLFLAPDLFPYALIWVSHIGFDRILGFGLKYPTHFRDTHLQHV